MNGERYKVQARQLADFHDYIKNKEIHITEEQVFDWLKMYHRWPLKWESNNFIEGTLIGGTTNFDSISVITNNRIKTMSFFTKLTPLGLYLNFDDWYYYHERGFTSTLNNILDLNEDLREIEKVSKEILGFAAHGNFYFSRKSDYNVASFAPHNHDYTVIIKQIYGTSRWILNHKEFDVKPQQSFIIPTGCEHAVISKKTDKLSLTINVGH